MQSKTAIGAFIRRIKSRLGAPAAINAINAGAHKLARLLYRMLKFGKAYVETGLPKKLFKERTLKIRDAGIPFCVPEPRKWNERVIFVLDAI